MRKNSSILSTANRGGQFNINTPSALGYTSVSGQNTGINIINNLGVVHSANPEIINFYGSFAEE